MCIRHPPNNQVDFAEQDLFGVRCVAPGCSQSACHGWSLPNTPRTPRAPRIALHAHMVLPPRRQRRVPGPDSARLHRACAHKCSPSPIVPSVPICRMCRAQHNARRCIQSHKLPVPIVQNKDMCFSNPPQSRQVPAHYGARDNVNRGPREPIASETCMTRAHAARSYGTARFSAVRLRQEYSWGEADTSTFYVAVSCDENAYSIDLMHRCTQT